MKRIEINKCIGITVNDELIMVDSIFNHGDNFHGATGTTFVGITQDYIDQRRDPENMASDLDYVWQEAVKAGQTEKGLDDYMKELNESNDCNSDGLFVGHDTSSIHQIPDSIKKEYFPECESFECIGGGRQFPIKSEWKVIFDQKLLDLVNQAESEDINLEQVAKQLEAAR